VFDEFADLLVAGVWRRLAVDGVDGVRPPSLLCSLITSFQGCDVAVILVDDFWTRSSCGIDEASNRRKATGVTRVSAMGTRYPPDRIHRFI